MAQIPLWRRALGSLLLLYMLVNAVSVLGSSSAYLGQSNRLMGQLETPANLHMPIKGPEAFQARTKLALALLHSRSPEFYLRIQRHVSSIEYLDHNYLVSQDSGKRISLEGIGAVAEPHSGRVQVLYGTAFPSGAEEYWDRDIYSYAGVLVHEMRHIELHSMRVAPGGWEEEALCERAAYAALVQAGAPGGVLARYYVYLENPRAKRYQRWYDWYKQWE